MPLAEYVEQADRAVFVRVMINTVEAIEGLDSIILISFDQRGEEFIDRIIRSVVTAEMDVYIDFGLMIQWTDRAI